MIIDKLCVAIAYKVHKPRTVIAHKGLFALAELLLHSEMNANELGFSGLSPKISFYIGVKWFKTFYDKTEPLIEYKDSKIYFYIKFIICRLNMYLNVLLYYLRSNVLS